MRHFRMQLVDQNGAAIQTSGGKAYVATNGDAAKATLYTETGAALANPVSLTNGILEFWVADAVTKVDLFIQAPSGHFIVTKNVLASGPNSLMVDTSRVLTTMVIPFAIGDTTANTETSTGFTVPTKAMVLPTASAIDVLTADSGMTIDVGTLSTDSGDADGFIDGISLASATMVKATNANGAVTLGALLYVQDSANAGDDFPEANISMQGKTITYTLSASTDTGEGFIFLNIALPYASLN